ncbi:MAG: DUF3592 domain-containing protein [Planctomycetota bacterium]|nr:MAG: DUF3592 domain-containing protein [Planctomycetota bacterium]
MHRNSFFGTAAILCIGGIASLIAGHFWWREYHAVGSWDQAPAMIHSSNLYRDQTRTGDGSYNTTYEIVAQYTYLYQNREYQGRRVGLVQESNFAGQYQRWQQTLQRHQRRREPIMIWVNPRNPSESLIFREATLVHYMLPAIGIACIFLGILAAIYWWSTAPVQRRPGKAAWQQEGLWQDNTARYEPWNEVWQTGCVTIAAIIIAVTVVYGIGKAELEAWASYLQWLIGLAPFAGVGYGGYQAIRAIRYGQTHLAIQRIPIHPGATMQAYLISKRPLPMASLHCQLCCERRRMEMRHMATTHNQNAKSATLVEVIDMVYTESWEVPVEEGGKYSRKHGWIVPLTKEIPDALPSRNVYAREPITWTLIVTGKTSGVNFHARYPLPVFT